jgi:hypothetical protein
METYDIYGFGTDDMDAVRCAIEEALGIHFEEHESSYLGIYFLFGDPGKEQLRLQRNIDPFDGEAAEQDFPEKPLLLFVDHTRRCEEIEKTFAAKLPSAKLLRRDQFGPDLQKIQDAMERGVSLPHQAASIGVDLYFLLQDGGQDQAEVRRLVARFMESLPLWGMEDVLANQAEYARRLASAPGELLYEEMHKLFSLCDDVRALRELGLDIGAKDLEEMDAALRARFSAEPRKARLVAEDKVDDGNRKWWWYADNLKKGIDTKGD